MPALKGFVGPTGRARSPTVACDRTVNMYVEESSNEKGVYTLYSMPGLRPVALLPSGPVRGLYEATNGRVFAVTSTTVFEIFAGWSFLSRGTIAPGTDPVSFTDDGIYLVLSANGVGYAMDFALNVFGGIPLTGPQTFGQLAYIDGMILTNEPGTRRWWYSDILAATTWPATSFYTAEARADQLLTILTDHREIWLPGTQSLEIWHPTGDVLSPFARSSTVFLEQGIETPWTVDALDNTIFWLGGTSRGEGPVWAARGYEPQRISSHALETAMGRMETLANARSWTARQGGHAWYGLDFPTGGQTWAYDTSTAAWLELAALADDGSLLPYPCWTHCMAFAEHLWGDRDTGRLYIWDEEYHYYGMQTRLCRRIAPHVRAAQKRLRHKEFRLEFEAGLGLDGGIIPGENPQVMLRYSDDGGTTFSQARWRSAGKIGARTYQAVWYQLGETRQRAYELSVSDPVKVAFLAAYLEVG